MITWYSYQPVYTSITINGDQAEVDAFSSSQVRFSNSGDVIENTDSTPHHIQLVKSDGTWRIKYDNYDSEMRRLYPDETDWNQLISQFDATFKEQQEKNDNITVDLKLKSKKDWRLKSRFENSPVNSASITTTTIVTPLYTYTAPNRSAEATYGTTYTDDSGTSATTYYNINFVNYAGNGGDCQNFLSQAIWAGFGGQNNSTAINGHYSPMIDMNQSGVYDWWADSSTTDSDWMWTGVNYFKPDIIANYDNDRLGVQGHVGSADYTEVGDYIYLPPGTPNYPDGHVFLVTSIHDYDGDGLTDYNEIDVSAHTANHKDHRLSDILPTPPSGMTYMWIAYYKS